MFWALTVVFQFFMPSIHFSLLQAALLAAFVNIQLPMYLGELVNVITDLVSDRGVGGAAVDLSCLKPVGTKIAIAYVVQVW